MSDFAHCLVGSSSGSQRVLLHKPQFVAVAARYIDINTDCGWSLQGSCPVKDWQHTQDDDEYSTNR
jgi:hypothetical protein